ncbi:uncharacterized protein LOC121466766 [Drosophila elegans]|uniref:uncharacterized protein LOC121466766 n=1 Tax=Drosophila elegans TaxID=30023 RepID=UPI001BC84369|nr:uncharacterized protein LOC121466766 [Drosophila elegans]
MKEASVGKVVEFLVHEVFYKFGVPEVIHSDNGKQFVSKIFQDMITAFGIQHMRTAVYSPQSNAAERKMIIETGTYTYRKVSIRDSVHEATGVTPFFAVFGQQMFLNGNCYKLARKLQSLTEHQITTLDPVDKRQLIRDHIRENLHQAYERSSQRYNKRARVFHAKPGQEIYRRNFTQSNFGKMYNAKFARKYVKCRVIRPIGNNAYELEDLGGKPWPLLTFQNFVQQAALIQISEPGLNDITIHVRAQHQAYSRRANKLFISETDIVESSANIVG